MREELRSYVMRKSDLLTIAECQVRGPLWLQLLPCFSGVFFSFAVCGFWSGGCKIYQLQSL